MLTAVSDQIIATRVAHALRGQHPVQKMVAVYQAATGPVIVPMVATRTGVVRLFVMTRSLPALMASAFRSSVVATVFKIVATALTNPMKPVVCHHATMTSLPVPMVNASTSNSPVTRERIV